MKLITAIILFIALCLPAKADVRDVVNATTKIYSNSGTSQSIGTGCVFGISNGKVYVLTNAHVVEGSPNSLDLIFYKWGHRSRVFKGKTEYKIKNNQADIAVVTVPESEFGKQLPSIIPIAPAGTKLKNGDCLWTNGCAKGAEPTMMAVRQISDNGIILEFRNPPQEGRSGSAMTDRDGKYICAILFARSIEENAVGMAVSLDMIRKYIYKEQTVSENTQDVIKPHVLLPSVTTKEIALMPYVTPRKIELLQYPYYESQCGPGGCPPRMTPRRPQPPAQPKPPNFGDYGEKLDGSDAFPTLPPDLDQKPDVNTLPVPEKPTDAKPEGKDKVIPWAKAHATNIAIVFLSIIVFIFVGSGVKRSLIAILKKELAK